jgi:exopolysaccharide biosynthesis polyprenyl glycosylphosphotransferase
MNATPLEGARQSLYATHIKRIMDIILSSIGLVTASPIIVLTALAIKLDSKGSVLYKQKRIGLNETEFELLKFRSMSVDAEADEQPVWAKENDPRTTRVGRIIRKTRIDEIPQMWNVLKGEMSFIGPRPERPEFVGKLEEDIPYYFFRHAVKPGITGWAQINYRYGASREDAAEKLQYDLFYIKNLSAFLDLRILMKTVEVVLFGKGAR